MFLEVQHLTKTYGPIVAVDDVSFGMEEGEILSLLGPSGCGKTTLLRLIAGLEKADRGRVLVNGRTPSPRPHERDFGMVFQSFALFPHLSVHDNIAFGLKIRGLTAAEIDRRVDEVIDLVDLEGTADRAIDQLSGGQQQRVALARSLAIQPRLLLLDEPLGALDRALREKLMIELREIIKRVGVTAISVTHDQSEAFAIADRIAVMNAGQIEQLAPPETLYEKPNSPFVARFLGFTNIVPGRRNGHGSIETPLGTFPDSESAGSGTVALLIRPDALVRQPVKGAVPFEGAITAVTFRGRYYQVAVRAADQELIFEIDGPRPQTGPFSGYILLSEVRPLPGR